MGDLGRVRLGSIRNKNNWNNASKRLFRSYSHSGIPGFRSGYSAPRSRIAGIYSGIHSYSRIFPNERALGLFHALSSTRIFFIGACVYMISVSRCKMTFFDSTIMKMPEIVFRQWKYFSQDSLLGDCRLPK